MMHVNEPLDRLRAAVRDLDPEEQAVFAEFVVRAIGVVIGETLATYLEGPEANAAKLPSLTRVLEKLQKAVQADKSGEMPS